MLRGKVLVPSRPVCCARDCRWLECRHAQAEMHVHATCVGCELVCSLARHIAKPVLFQLHAVTSTLDPLASSSPTTSRRWHVNIPCHPSSSSKSAHPCCADPVDPTLVPSTLLPPPAFAFELLLAFRLFARGGGARPREAELPCRGGESMAGGCSRSLRGRGVRGGEW